MVGKVVKKSKILWILNKYKNTLDNLIDSLDTEFLDYLDSRNRSRLIDKGLRNALKSRDGSPTFLEKDCLNENISITLLELAFKIQDYLMQQCLNITTFDTKCGKAQYEKSHQNGKDKKSRKNEEDWEGQKNWEGHWENKVNFLVR